LSRGFHSLIYAGRASGKAAGLQSALGGAGDAAFKADRIIRSQLPALAANGKPNRLQREGGVYAERIVIFKKLI